MNEIWKPVVGFEGLYEISNLGNLNRLQQMGRWSPGVVKGWIDSKGYSMCRLTKNKQTKNIYRHILVAQAFIGARPPRLDINHKNGIKTDSRQENLEYVTRQENINHSFRTGLHKPLIGNKHWNARVSENDVLDMRRLRKIGTSVKVIAKRYGLTWNYIYNLTNGKTWSHI